MSKDVEQWLIRKDNPELAKAVQEAMTCKMTANDIFHAILHRIGHLRGKRAEAAQRELGILMAARDAYEDAVFEVEEK
jgi:hypothetical protein